MDRWVDRFGAPREICSDRGPEFVRQCFQTLSSKIDARSTMCLAGRHQGNGKAENTGKQLRRAVAKALTLRKGTNRVEVLPDVVRAWHENTGPSGYPPNDKQSNRQITEEDSSSTILKHVKSVESVLVRNTNSQILELCNVTSN